MDKQIRILMVEDSTSDAQLIERKFVKAGYAPRCRCAQNGEEMRHALREEEWDVIIADYNLPSFDAPAALRLLRETGKDIPFLIVSGSIGEEIAVEMMRSGANDYLLKDNLVRLIPAVEREVREAESRRQRRRAESAIEEGRQVLQAVVASALDGVVAMDIDGNVMLWNPAAERMFGYTADQAEGKSVHQLMMPSRFRPAFEAGMRNFTSTGRGVILGRTVELSALHRDGREFPVELSVGAIGTGLECVGVIRDISARKRAEARIAGESALLRKLAAGEPLDKLMEDLRLYVESTFPPNKVSVWIERQSGNAADVPRSLTGCYFVPIQNREGAVIGRIQIASTESPTTENLESLRTAADLAALAIEKTEAEKTIRRTNERLMLHMLGTPMAYVELDQTGAVRFWNPAAETLFGYPQSEATGKNMRELLHSDSLMSFDPQHGNRLETTLEHTTREGRTITCDWYGTRLVNEEGEAIGVACLGQDVTELKRLVERLRLSKEASEAATRAKSEFLSTMSHEIRTPMNGILGMSSLLLDSALTPEQQGFAQAIRTSADALLCIINDILDFSKVEAGKLDIEVVPFNLQTAIEDVLDLVSLRAKEKGLELLVWYPPAAVREYQGDVGRIRQILLNLVTNAIKFTDRGHVLVEVEVRASDAGRADLRIAVQDTGIGIGPDQFHLLFSQFTQLDSSSKRRFGGSGLGLAISKRLAKLMGGDIEVVSQLGEGSTFTLSLPLDLQIDGGLHGTKTPDLRGIRVLIVEDHQISRFVNAEWCASWGMRVDEASSAGEAMEKFQQAWDAKDPFQVCIVDYLLPDMHGGNFARNMHAILPKVPVILLTGFDLTRLEDQIRQEFAALVSKPVRAATVHDVLVRTLQPRERERRPPEQQSKREILFPGMRILVVEDNVINQRVATALLRKLGCSVEIAANGREALETLQRFQFDLVFMDCQMPEMDGFETTAEIRKQPAPICDLPVIAMTAGAMEADRNKCLAAGMNDHMAKPILPELVKSILRQWWEKAKSPVPAAMAHVPQGSAEPIANV